MSAVVLSIDVGGTKTLVGAIDASGRVVGEWSQPTRVGTDDVQRVAEFARSCARALLGGDAALDPVAVAAGFPEYVAPPGMLTSTEVLDWAEQPSTALARAFDGLVAPERIVVDSDVRLGALGEARYGAGAGRSSFLYVSLGTGLSSSLVLDGRVWPGHRGEAIALGAMRAGGDELLDLESFASGHGIEQRYAERTGRRASGPEITRAAADGDAIALEVLETAGDALGDAIADLAAVLDPDAIILGGGLGTADTPLRLRASERYSARQSRRPRPPQFLQAACGARSGLMGGAAAAWRTLDPRPETSSR